MADTFDERSLPHPGDVIDERYRLERLLGVGGMGAVYAATDGARRGQVAIKVLLPEEVENTESSRRFLREARAAQALESPHVAQVIGTGTLSNGLPYMVLELLDGESLDRIIRDRAPLGVDEAVDVLLQACEGVAAAHARGIIHRDLKPSNLHTTTVGDGRRIVKVLDFGIAKATARLDPHTDGLSLTETSSTLGSPQYMSPEQLRSSKSVDPRTDIWSLGLILHKLLTGRAAFEADNVGAMFAMVVSDPPTPLRVHRPDLSAELEAVVLSCLEKPLDHRFQDVGQLAEALAPFTNDEGRARIRRIRSILDGAGASSPSLPRPSHPSAPWVDQLAITDAARTRTWRRDETDRTARTWNTSPAAAPGRRRGPWLALGVGLAAVVLGSLGYYHLGGGRDGSSEPTAAAPGPSASEPAATTAKETDTAAETVQIRLTIEPADATVWLDGARTPDNPITLARGARIHELVIRAPGHVAERREFQALEDQALELRLVAQPTTAEPPAARPKSSPPPARPPPKVDEPVPVHPKGPWADDL